MAEGNPRRTLTFSTRGVASRALSPLVRLHCPHSAPHLAMHTGRASTELRACATPLEELRAGCGDAARRRCAPSPRPAAHLCVRRLACWFQLLESSAFVVAGDYERGGLAAHTCPPLRLYEAVRRKGSRRSIRQAAHGWPAVHRVRRRCHRPVSRAWAARRPSTAVAAPAARAAGRSSQGACPRCTRALATGSQNSAGARVAQRPRRLWQSSFPTPDAVSLVQTCRTLQPVWHRAPPLGPRDGRERRAPITRVFLSFR